MPNKLIINKIRFKIPPKFSTIITPFKIIIDKFYLKTDIIQSKFYITLDQLCAYTISQYIYFDIYLELKKITNNEVSLCF